MLRMTLTWAGHCQGMSWTHAGHMLATCTRGTCSISDDPKNTVQAVVGDNYHWEMIIYKWLSSQAGAFVVQSG